jgi:hypothetical protein
VIGLGFFFLLIATPDDTPRDSQPEVILCLSIVGIIARGETCLLL